MVSQLEKITTIPHFLVERMQEDDPIQLLVKCFTMWYTQIQEIV